MTSEDISYYWCELYPWKESDSNLLFEINKPDAREEYYISKRKESGYDLYVISNDNILIEKHEISQRDMLKRVSILKSEYWSKSINVEPKGDSKNKAYYQTHTLFVASEYENILNSLLKSLSEEYFYFLNNSADLIRLNYKTFWTGNDAFDPNLFSLELFRSKTECNEGYPGCLVSVQNIPFMITNLSELEEPIYSWVYEKLEDVPCIVKFNFPNSVYHFGDTTLNSFVKPFYTELSNNGIKSVLLSASDEAFYIKTNPFIPDDERLSKLEIYSSKILTNEFIKKWQSKAEEILGSFWHQLSPVSKLSFPMGVGLYELYKPFKSNILDCSSPSIHLAKCIEIEIEQKILLPFRNYFTNRGYNNLNNQTDLTDSQISRMTNFLIKPESKPPELGTYAFFLSIVHNSKTRSESSITIKAYKEFILSFQNSNFLISNYFMNVLNLISSKYRNGAAHTKALPYAYLDEFYELLIGINQEGFIFKLLSALRTKKDFSDNV